MKRTEPEDREGLRALGAFLRSRRQLASMTQREVAVLVDCEPKTIGTWERGERQPRPAALSALARIYSVRVADIERKLVADTDSPDHVATAERPLDEINRVLAGKPDFVVRAVRDVARVLAAEFPGRSGRAR